MKLYIGICCGLLVLFNPVRGDAQQAVSSLPTVTLGPQDVIELHVCRDFPLGVKLLCNPQWGLQTDKDTILILVSKDPAVTITIARADSPVIFVEQLTRPLLQEMGQYADGFMTEHVKFAGLKAIKVEGFARDFPEIRLLDFYVIHDFRLYSVLFSVNPKEQWGMYQPLIKKIMETFEFLDPSEDVYGLEKLKSGELKPVIPRGDPGSLDSAAPGL